MEKEIKLLCGSVTLVDDEDYLEVNKYKWRISSTGYVVRGTSVNKRCKTLRLHRVLLIAQKGQVIDHINGEKLDNRKSNLRVVTTTQNAWNQKLRTDSTSGYKGVSWIKARSKWRVEIKKDYQGMHLGYFDNPHDAARMYNFWALDMFGEYARLNVITD